MANSKPFFLFKNYVQHVPKEEIKTTVPGLVRGIYILFEEDENKKDERRIYWSVCGRQEPRYWREVTSPQENKDKLVAFLGF